MRIRPFALLMNVAALFVAVSMFSCKGGDDAIDNGGGTDTPTHENLSFDFEDIDVDHTRFDIDIIPKNKAQEYIVFLSEKKHFIANHIDTRDELLEDDYLYLSELAENYGMGVREFLTKIGWLLSGDKLDYGAVNLYPDTEYVVYCYGVEFDGEYYEAVTEISYVEIRTTTPKMVDVNFDVKSKIDGNTVSIAINPWDYKGYYYSYIVPETDSFFIYEGMEVGKEYIEHYRNRAFDEFNELINDLGTAPKDFCHSGKTSVEQRLEPNTKYQIVLFAVSNDQVPLLCSVPQPLHFETFNVAMSDLVVNIDVTDIHPYYAELTLTPSNNDEKYCGVFLSRDQVPPHEDEYEQMLAIIEYYQPSIFTGVKSERLMPLMPNSDYTVLAFGIDNNIPTTKLFRYDFTSGHADPGKINVESIDLVKLFDAEEIVALNSSYAKVLSECECVAVVQMKTSAPTDKVYFWWFEQWMKVEYSDEAFLEEFLLYDPSNNPELMDMYYSTNEEDKFFFAGIAEDEDGNMSPIYYGESFTLSKSQCAPAEEFFQYVEGTRSSDYVIIGR